MVGDKSKIEWTDATWNPVSGCTPVSAGCANCYAARMVKRFPHTHGVPFRGDNNLIEGRPFSKILFHPDRLDIPLRWKKPRRIFVCSMGDLFHEDVKEEWLTLVFMTMAAAQRHTFMILTKRPTRMMDFMTQAFDATHIIPPHVWLGVTAENQEMADLRIPILLQTPAAKRFVSIEPCLGPVDLCRFEMRPDSKIDWVICGGESGPGARPMHPGWPRFLRDQCQAASVPFFFKQWGEYSPCERWIPGSINLGDVSMMRIGKKAAGCLLVGREWKEFPV